MLEKRSWPLKQVGGYPYTLYKEYNGTRYFADASEGFDEVEEINASSDKEAIEIFSDIMILKEEQ